ncbi:MAG: hypothetical protein VKM97_03730 [Cyanobacteriota bacterium]|nr:hypothetical protein [Cyanobacteriota bacterium]
MTDIRGEIIDRCRVLLQGGGMLLKSGRMLLKSISLLLQPD